MMDFLRKIISGFGVGLGFAIAVVIVITFSMNLIVGKMYEETMTATEEYMFKEYKADESNLIITNESSQKDDSGFTITGSVRNDDEVAWSNINIEVELFDKDGAFVHECSEYISQKVAPGSLENFKLKCKGCKKSKIPEFESYEIKIVNASSMFSS